MSNELDIDDACATSELAKRQLAVLRGGLTEHEQSEDLRWAANQRAIDRWRKANPGNDLIRPDRADLLVWLMERLDALQKRIADAPRIGVEKHAGMGMVRCNGLPIEWFGKRVALVVLGESE